MANVLKKDTQKREGPVARRWGLVAAAPPGNSHGPQRQEGAGRGLPWGPHGVGGPANRISDFWPPRLRENIFVLFLSSLLPCGNLLQ